jgi:hypothetical protein
MVKEVGVKMSIKGQDVKIMSPVRHKFDVNDNLILTFMIGASGSDEVKLTFDKREFFDVEDDTSK